jgi:hypothetical protein
MRSFAYPTNPLALGLALALLAVACGDSSDPKTTMDGGDADVELDADVGSDAAANDPDASVDNTQDLSELTNEEGQALCMQQKDFANDKLTPEERLTVTCLISLYGNGTLPASLGECEDAVDACAETEEVDPLLAPLNFDCGQVMTESCPPGATVGQLENCVDGFAALWTALAPVTSCDALLEPNALALLQGALGPAIQNFQAGLADCQSVAAACPAGFVPAD